MLSTCLNENDSQVKKDIRKYGRETVYRKFIDNNYVYPLTFNDSKTIRVDQAREYLRSVLPSTIGVESMERILPLLEVQGITGNLLGTFFNDLIYLSDSATYETSRHEAFHTIFQRLISPEQREELLPKAQLQLAERLKKSGSTINQLLKDRRSRGLYRELNDAQAKNLLYEEELADQFAVYQPRVAKNTLEKVFNSIRDLIDWFTGDSEIKKLFQQIDNGYYVNHRVTKDLEAFPISFELYTGNQMLSNGEAQELVRGISVENLLSGEDIEQTLSDLHSEYLVSSEQIVEVGEMKGYSEDEIVSEAENIEAEILGNKGFPVLAGILSSPSQTTRLKNMLELYNAQFGSAIERYIATATDQFPVITNESERVGDRRITFPSSTPIRTSEVYTVISEISAQEGLIEDKFINLYDRMQTTPDTQRFFSKFIEDVFENPSAVIEGLNEGEFPSLSNLNPVQREIFSGMTQMLYTGNEVLNTQMERILQQQASNRIYREILEDNGVKLNTDNQEIFDTESVENSKQETCN